MSIMRTKSEVTRLQLCIQPKTAKYCPKYSLFTPWNGRIKVRNRAHKPSMVLTCTSRTPSPSSSRAHSRTPGAWHTVLCTRPLDATQLYPCHSSLLKVVAAALAASPSERNSAVLLCSNTRRRICPLVRPTTPPTGGRSLSQVPCPRRLLARRRGGEAGSAWRWPFCPALIYTSSPSVTSSSNAQGGKALRQQRLDGMAAGQQAAAVNMQFGGQVLRGYALRDAAQEQDNKPAGVVGFGEQRAREKVEDGATLPTAIVENGS